MTLRSLAASLAIALLMGLAVNAPAQTQPKGEDSPSTGKADENKSQDKADEAKDKPDDKGKPDESKVKLEKATFGGGCFWCLEAVYERIPGVKSVVSGYAGGTVPRPTYEMVSSGLTGHAEVVQLVYDPEVAPYEKLLKVFWACHNPTTLNQQGPDFGTQYRSIILYHNEDQKKAALKSYKELTDAGVFADPIVTQLEPLKAFYPAERYHQDYFRKNSSAPYCQAEIVPKLRKLKLIK
ncbi:peptide-methionine (S)-S-oxide reductase MsrA [Singulisphaera acidiphila]|uniref:Peptide methionine sulfoxide reductase MsrA n=1 Tax=Singulisphaera acidiphila (strain ATCC BAA-1392 / DSM 18658 / VKM B-2454 / MOB10) TaxID=886293 RepID=L0DFL6_SINAD|nr:peptide-methionine (S)-S-oxide reductase MsrA [Singulisphaera acidiphila]AGA28052.1 methionine-S-sulfoxide reductase [Singulisphaera acidiphila DSM 18658]